MNTIPNIESFVHNDHEWLRELQDELHPSWPEAAFQAFRAVLHVLRDRLNMEEAVDLGAELPMVLRRIYYEAWNPTGPPLRIGSREEMIAEVSARFIPPNSQDPAEAVYAVVRLLQRRIFSGEIKDVFSELPEELSVLWKPP